MNIRTSLLATGAAIAFAGLASAQYDQNWAIASSSTGNVFGSGPDWFTLGGATPNFADGGDAIRHCYGIDQTQGGTNQTGQYTNTTFRIIQGWAATNTVAGNIVGVTSLASQTVDSLAGDACFSPIFTGAQPGLISELAWAFNIGLLGGTAGTPAPGFWATAFAWVTPVTGSNTLGTDGSGFPLLANVIYEIQGPANGGPLNNQYYLASTSELIGTNPSAPGGVANGNPLLASALAAGADAVTTNSITYTRLTSQIGGTITGYLGNPWTAGGPGTIEFRGDVGFATPQVWATKNGNEGTGGPDWQISAAPVSTVDLRLLDVRGGATNVAAGTSVSDACIVFNQSFYLWSATPGTLMLQQPMSWDTTPVLFALPPQPGSFILGPLVTSRQGAQTVPANFDGVMQLFLGVSPLSLGKPITNAADPFVDGTAGALGQLALNTLFQGAFAPVSNGVSTLTGGGGPLSANPIPNLAGQQIGIAGLGLQFDACAFSLAPSEIGSSVHISLQ